MKKALLKAIKNNDYVTCGKNTFNSLLLRNLCYPNPNSKLTEEGKVVAISLSSLKTQTEVLKINLKTLPYRNKNIPKIQTKNYLSKFFDYTNPEHYKVIVSSEVLRTKVYPEILVCNILLKHGNFRFICYDEGRSILTLLTCMTFDIIVNEWTTYNKISNSEENEHNYFMFGPSLDSIRYLSLIKNEQGYYEAITKRLINKAKNSKIDNVEKAFLEIGKIQTYHTNISNEKNCITWPLLKSLYLSLGNNTLIEVLKIYLMDQGAFGKGWPDLTAIDKNEKVILLEVKTTDKLHISQIITIKEISKLIPVEILKIVNS